MVEKIQHRMCIVVEQDKDLYYDFVNLEGLIHEKISKMTGVKILSFEIEPKL